MKNYRTSNSIINIEEKIKKINFENNITKYLDLEVSIIYTIKIFETVYNSKHFEKVKFSIDFFIYLFNIFKTIKL